MSHVNEYKIKLLVLWDILCRFTDEEHPMNTDEIIEKLGEKGIASSRKVLAADIALLNEYGYSHILRFQIPPRRQYFARAYSEIRNHLAMETQCPNLQQIRLFYRQNRKGTRHDGW